MENLFIGCSGFHYKEWRGVFYPEKLTQKKWFSFYASQFNTLEINSSFYRYPKLEVLQQWYDGSRENFKFSIKVPRTITHYRRFNNVEGPLDDFHKLIKKGLREKLACVLYQLPGNLKYSIEMLHQIVNQMDLSLRNVIEFRHPTWWNHDVYQVLNEHNITFCSISHPSLPQTIMETNGILYLRFHGVPELYLSVYTKEELDEWYRKVAQISSFQEHYIYFNNTMTTGAIDNLHYLRKRLASDETF